MPASVIERTEVFVYNSEGELVTAHEQTRRYAPGLGNGKRETVSLTGSAFTALSPPTGSKRAILIIPETAASLVLKGITGDTGISLAPASNYIGANVMLTLGSAPSIGILNSGSTVSIEIIWL